MKPTKGFFSCSANRKQFPEDIVALAKLSLHKYNIVIINSLCFSVGEEWRSRGGGGITGGKRKTRILDLLKQDFIKV